MRVLVGRKRETFTVKPEETPLGFCFFGFCFCFCFFFLRVTPSDYHCSTAQVSLTKKPIYFLFLVF
jgi:hypothetical protein